MIVEKTFSSEKSKDSINVTYFKKSHKSNLDVVMFDDIVEHMGLLGEVITYLKNNGIQWICVPIRSDPVIPENTLFFKHEKFNRICCHVEGFENFYIMNLSSSLDMNKVYVESREQAGGWKVVQDRRKPIRTKLANIKRDIADMITKMNI